MTQNGRFYRKEDKAGHYWQARDLVSGQAISLEGLAGGVTMQMTPSLGVGEGPSDITSLVLTRKLLI